jgi:hypothetical protein
MRFLSPATTLAGLFLLLSALGSGGSLAADAYDLVVLRPPQGGAGMVFRLDVTTGQVSAVSGSGFAPVKDPQPIPLGLYRLYPSETPDKASFWLYRLETLSGRLWSYANGAWSEIK